MKWVTHQTGAIFAATLLSFPLPAIAAAWVGAVFPDIVDQKLSELGNNPRTRQRIFNRVHRGTSHWVGWWLGIFCFSLAAPLPFPIKMILGGFALGGISHLVLDMLTPQGIPLWPFSRKGRISVPVCATGKASEYLFLAAMLVGGGIYWKQELLGVLANLLQFFQ